VFEATPDGKVQAKYPSFDNKVVALPGESFEIRWKSPT
jgi:hypothetical protein